MKVLESGKAIEVSGTGWKDKAQGARYFCQADKGALTRDGNVVISEIEATQVVLSKPSSPFQQPLMDTTRRGLLATQSISSTFSQTSVKTATLSAHQSLP